jgi:hypothetical protein
MRIRRSSNAAHNGRNAWRRSLNRLEALAGRIIVAE